MFTNTCPLNNKHIFSPEINISVIVKDETTVVDSNSILLTVNGQETQHAFNPMTGRISSILKNNFTSGHYDIKVQAADELGNQNSISWSFDWTKTNSCYNPCYSFYSNFNCGNIFDDIINNTGCNSGIKFNWKKRKP